MLTEKEIRELLEYKGKPCISLFMPLSQQPDQREANRIRLKNLIKQAEKQLTAASIKAVDVLSPAMNLLTNGRLHQQKSAGLAVFMKVGFSQHFFMPITMPELVVVGQRFHVKPLLPLLQSYGHFHILALSQNKVALFQASRYHIEPVTLPNLPENMADALQYEDPEKQLQRHAITGQTGTFHGHEVDAEKKGAILRYFRQLDDVVTNYLQKEKTPLILACVEYLVPIYRMANNYADLLEEGISGNPDEVSSTELQQQALQIISSRLEAEQTAAAEQYQALATTERASADVTEIVSAAHFGRIDTLFTPVGQQQWGRFDAQSGQVQLCQTAEPNAVDLLDSAAVHTLLNGGTVYAVKPNEVPDDAVLTAVFRY